LANRLRKMRNLGQQGRASSTTPKTLIGRRQREQSQRPPADRSKTCCGKFSQLIMRMPSGSRWSRVARISTRRFARSCRGRTARTSNPLSHKTQLEGLEPSTFGSVDQTARAISLRKSHLRFPHFTRIATIYMGMVRVWYAGASLGARKPRPRAWDSRYVFELSLLEKAGLLRTSRARHP